MQAIVLNPIADPYILGISSGASAGAAWALLMPLPFFAGQYQVTVTAMIGALIASAAVYSMAKIGNHGQIKPVITAFVGNGSKCCYERHHLTSDLSGQESGEYCSSL